MGVVDEPLPEGAIDVRPGDGDDPRGDDGDALPLRHGGHGHLGDLGVVGEALLDLDG